MTGAGLAALSALMFGVTNVLIRRGIPSESTKAGMLVMSVVNCVVLVALFTAFVVVRGIPEGHWTGAVWFALAGVAGPLLGQWALMGSIARIGASKGSALKNAAPAVTVGLAVLLIGEELSPSSLVGMLFVFTGLGVLAWGVWRRGESPLPLAALSDGALPLVPPSGRPDARRRRASPRDGQSFGLLLGIGAAFGLGLSQIFRKLGMIDLPDAVLGAALSAVAALVVFTMLRPGDVIGRGARAALGHHFNRWMAMAGLASSIGQVSFYLALNTLEVSRVALITSSDVVLTLILAAILLRDYERISLSVIVSAGLVLCGVVIVSVR